MMNGNAKEALQFYEKALGAEVIEIISYGDMPDLPSEDFKDLIAHAKLKIGSDVLMLSDSPSTMPIQKGNQVEVCITTNHVDTSKQYFEALMLGGKAMMPFEETSFSPGYGSLVDQFGVTFSISTEFENKS
ncbi:VOC family protein [Bacillus sp. JCM 19034]|uniref:VOC family protein n=1 Tax=Bacillus sp. JCM 19034 TaxID=1481928 RepID=UPI000781A932|nr:VOC family protein [Bacillus sp. JCM 19034]